MIVTPEAFAALGACPTASAIMQQSQGHMGPPVLELGMEYSCGVQDVDADRTAARIVWLERHAPAAQVRVLVLRD